MKKLSCYLDKLFVEQCSTFIYAVCIFWLVFGWMGPCQSIGWSHFLPGTGKILQSTPCMSCRAVIVTSNPRENRAMTRISFRRCQQNHNSPGIFFGIWGLICGKLTGWFKLGSTLHLVTVAFLTVYRDDPLSKIASWVGGGEPKVYRKTLLVFSLKILLMPQKISGQPPWNLWNFINPP